ncbi:MAG: hypothetical protein QOE51_3621 [Actinoplanes sp.]|nr:hypothetical protein [Actinoplanes sp.]
MPEDDDRLVPPLKVMRRRLDGVYSAGGFRAPTRRYVAIVALLVGLASVPTLAAITAGSLDDDTTSGAMDVPLLPQISPGPVGPGDSTGSGPARTETPAPSATPAPSTTPPRPTRSPRPIRGQAGPRVARPSAPSPSRNETPGPGSRPPRHRATPKKPSRTGPAESAPHSSGQHSSGQHSSGRHSSGQDSSGQHSSGPDSSGSDSPGEHSSGSHSSGSGSPGRGRHRSEGSGRARPDRNHRCSDQSIQDADRHGRGKRFRSSFDNRSASSTWSQSRRSEVPERPQNLRPSRTAERTHNDHDSQYPAGGQTAGSSYRGGHRAERRHRPDDDQRRSRVGHHHSAGHRDQPGRW